MTSGAPHEVPTESRSQRGDDQAALLRIAAIVGRDAPEEELFAAAAEEAARLVGAQATGVMRFLGGERAVVVGVWREDGVRGMPVNAELDFDPRHSSLGRVWSTGRPARVESYKDASGDFPVVMHAMGMRSSVAAPIVLRDELWGALVAATTRDRPLPQGSEDRIAGVAEFAGHAVANGDARRLAAASRRRLVEAADEARRALERALHEGHQQQLLALALELRLARSRADAGSELAGMLERAHARAMEANASLREFARELYPAVLSERGLGAALLALATRARVPVYLRELPRRRFPAVIEATVYFVVSEVANAAEHAHATEVVVAIADRGDRLVIEVSVDGSGEADPHADSGLRAIADRAAAVGGRLDVDSASGGGTAVRLELPVER